MEKPITLRIEELKMNLNKVVVDSGLPPFLLEMCIGEYLAGISTVAKREYDQDLAEWEKYNEQKEGEE